MTTTHTEYGYELTPEMWDRVTDLRDCLTMPVQILTSQYIVDMIQE